MSSIALVIGVFCVFVVGAAVVALGAAFASVRRKSSRAAEEGYRPCPNCNAAIAPDEKTCPRCDTSSADQDVTVNEER